MYGPNADFGNWLAKDFGITARFYDPLIGAGIADLIQPNTRLIWIEAPGSVTMEVPDVQAITAAAKARGIVTAIDNTFSAGAFKPFEHGVDISVQALTKYQSGGSDVLMGRRSPRTRRCIAAEARADALRCRRVGRRLLARAAQPALMQVRFDAHKSALALAQWLKARPEIAAVLHPQIADCPGHASFMRDFTGAGGLFSVVFDERYSAEQVDRFVESLELFAIGWSWGGACSLAMPYDVASMRPDWAHRGTLVRFYVGLEDEGDLRADIERAMQAALG